MITEGTSETPNEAPPQSDESAPLIGAPEAEEEAPAFGADEVTADVLQLPEGITLDETQSAEFLELVNSAGSKADLANAMLAMYAQVQTENATEAGEAWNAAQEEWRNEIKADTEFGGDKMPESLAKANEIVTRYGDADFNAALNLTGMGNNVHFLRFLMKVNGDIPQQATPVTGSPASGSRSLADRMFSPKEGA